MPISTVPIDESSSSANLLRVEAQSSSATMLCWNKETVSRIIIKFPQTVKVRVSHPSLTDECVLDINKALLIRFSPYYRAVFLGGFSDKDKETFVMEILLEDMIVFRRWLYDGSLMFADDAAEYRQLTRLYVFADYYDFPALRRAIMSLLVRNNKEHHDYRVPHLPLLEDCLSQLPQTSPLYRWLAATWVEHIDDIEVYGADTRFKLTQLDSDILRKALGDFEDDAAAAEIKRLKRANLELVKVVSALDDMAGSFNVAKIGNLKATCRNE
ncbi:hypothetical protein KCV05_g1050, partial [Aureobasidium melanogenum]